MIKVLTIGNSFSHDSHVWLKPLAAAHGVEMELVNLYIGGCTLERHWEHMKANEPAHLLRRNGALAVDCTEHISIPDGLELDAFDVVTTHQSSDKAGFAENFSPYADEIFALAREKQPQAQLWLMEPWAYEKDFDHEHFDNYGRDQRYMYRRISQTCPEIARKLGVGLIPVGTAIQRVRETVPEFDYANGGLSLCRDGRHLSRDYGRFTPPPHGSARLPAGSWRSGNLRILTLC